MLTERPQRSIHFKRPVWNEVSPEIHLVVVIDKLQGESGVRQLHGLQQDSIRGLAGLQGSLTPSWKWHDYLKKGLEIWLYVWLLSVFAPFYLLFPHLQKELWSQVLKLALSTAQVPLRHTASQTTKTCAILQTNKSTQHPESALILPHKNVQSLWNPNTTTPVA